VSAKYNDGLTALHAAAAGGHEAILKLLLGRGGTDIEAKDNK
jgi:ankyrin repeat protein